MPGEDYYHIQLQPDSAWALKHCAATIMESPEEYVERSFMLGVRLAHVALEYPESQQLVLCAMDPDGLLGQIPLSFSQTSTAPPVQREPLDDNLLAFEAQFQEIEAELPRRVRVPGSVMRDAAAYAFQLGSSVDNFFISAVELRTFWVQARSQQGDVLLDDGSSNLRLLYSCDDPTPFD
jgi:hypothetical protein